MRMGQLVALHRPPPGARASPSSSTPASAGCSPPAPATLACAGSRACAPVRSLIVLLLDHEPGRDEIRRIQAQENQREDLTLADQQAQFADCWAARAGLRRERPDRRRLRRPRHRRRQGPQPAPPAHAARADPRARRRTPRRATSCRSRWPTASPTCTRSRPSSPRPSRTRITTPDLHDARAARPRRLRAPHARRGRARLRRAHRRRRPARRRTTQIALARAHLTAADRRAAGRRSLGCAPDELDSELDALAATRQAHARCKLRVDGALRDRARTGRYAYVHDRGPDFAAGIWVIDPRLHARRRPPGSSTDARRRPAPRRPGLLRRRRPRRRPTCATAAEQDRAQRADERAAPGRGDAHQPRARPRPARRPDRPHRRPARRAAARSSATCSPATTAT